MDDIYSASECDLVIDDDFEDNLGNFKKRQKGVRLKEEPTILKCTWDGCDRSFENYSLFVSHTQDHALNSEENEDGFFVCSFENCDFEAFVLEVLVFHVAYHAYHDRLKNIGSNVEERLKLPPCLQIAQFKIPKVAEKYACEWDTCKFSFLTIQEFISHVKVHYYALDKYCKKGEYHKCQWLGCNLKFATFYKLNDHMRSHTKERIIACPMCGNMFCSKSKFIDHRKRQIPIEQHTFKCSECSKVFPTERLLCEHLRTHINHYKCTLCEMTCPKPSTLALHIRFRHLNERPFKCSLCGLACVTKSNLSQHYLTHYTDNLLSCDECSYQCKSFYGMDRHYQVKHGKDPKNIYECHCCQSRFNRGAHLTKHLIKRHNYRWPSGHSRFRYKADEDGVHRLQTVRYETIEVTKEMMDKGKQNQNENVPEQSTIAKTNLNFKIEEKVEDSKIKVNIEICDEGKNMKTDEKGDENFLLMLNESTEENIICNTNKDIIITISDVDSSGTVIKSKVINSKEIVKTTFKKESSVQSDC